MNPETLTRREAFIAAALTGLMANPNVVNEAEAVASGRKLYDHLARISITAADATEKALKEAK